MVKESKITKLYIMNVLNCSAVYAQKMLDTYKGDERGLKREILVQIYKRENTPAILNVN